MTGSAVLEILILAGFAVFVAYRLYSVLGRRTGNEETPPFDPIRRERVETRRPTTPATAEDDNIVALPRSREIPRPAADSLEAKIAPGSALALGIEQVRQVDRNFSPDGFVGGAKMA